MLHISSLRSDPRLNHNKRVKVVMKSINASDQKEGWLEQIKEGIKQIKKIKKVSNKKAEKELSNIVAAIIKCLTDGEKCTHSKLIKATCMKS